MEPSFIPRAALVKSYVPDPYARFQTALATNVIIIDTYSKTLSLLYLFSIFIIIRQILKFSNTLREMMLTSKPEDFYGKTFQRTNFKQGVYLYLKRN